MTATKPMDAPLAGATGARRLLFLGCFISLVATSFGFVIRSFIIGDLQAEFALSETQKGEILGVGLWPFAISIVLFSLIIDRIGYGKAMIFAFICHVASAIITIFATGYQSLYWGTFVVALAAGTVEAVINPVVATMYPRNKTTMLTVLHAGWPGGIVLGGILTLAMSGAGHEIYGLAAWKVKVLLLLIPTAAYGVILLFCRFPASERVVAGVPYRDMLREAGAIGWFIVVYMIMKEIGRVSGMDAFWVWTAIVATTLMYLFYTRSLGRPMYIFLLLVMILLAITELGTDTWMKELRDPAMRQIGLSGGWILVYTAGIMMVLRFCISPIVKLLRPLGVLLAGSIFAAVGLYVLSGAQGAWIILITATIYGVGQTYFWPVTLGVVSERFPRGGALTLNAIAGVGMLGVGIIGGPLMGYLQDTHVDENLKAQPQLHSQFIENTTRQSVLGEYRPLDIEKFENVQTRVKLYEHKDNLTDPSNRDLVRAAYFGLAHKEGQEAPEAQAEKVGAIEAAGLIPTAEQYSQMKQEADAVESVRNEARESAMKRIAILPIIMAACYLGLIFYFRSKGGYKAVELTASGKVAGEHPVTPQEAVADEEASPSE